MDVASLSARAARADGYAASLACAAFVARPGRRRRRRERRDIGRRSLVCPLARPPLLLHQSLDGCNACLGNDCSESAQQLLRPPPLHLAPLSRLAQRAAGAKLTEPYRSCPTLLVAPSSAPQPSGKTRPAPPPPPPYRRAQHWQVCSSSGSIGPLSRPHPLLPPLRLPPRLPVELRQLAERDNLPSARPRPRLQPRLRLLAPARVHAQLRARRACRCRQACRARPCPSSCRARSSKRWRC
jgi:hypothetical protein